MARTLIDPITPENRRANLNTMNALQTGETGAFSLSQDQTICSNFEAQVRRCPDAVALKFGDSTLTYSQLNCRANMLAEHLRNLGIGPEKPVALYLERSLEMVVAILGVLKAGAPYVPIDLAYPHDRMQFMLEDTAASVVLTQRPLREALPRTTATVLCLDETPVADSEVTTENPAPAITSANAAYIIYTSGSTGKPKGVIVTHGNVVRLLRSTQHWFKFNASDIWPLFHSYSFDMSVWELWGSLFYGGKLVVVPQAIARSPQAFYELLSAEKVTFLNQTPSAFRQLIWADATAQTPLPLSLRHVTCGGEALELQSLRPWYERHSDQFPVIVNMYGITETTVHTTYRPISKADLDSGVGSVIGVPIPDLKVYLLDGQLKPVGAGVPGEICVGGAGVARGYLNRPELNAARFIADPFEPAGGTMYRSGDLAQINALGEMEYLGRMDHQVKIRGFRVELGEIESALNRHDGIRESVVLAKGEGESKRLVAYYVPDGEALSTSALREYLAPKVPDYMVPALFVTLKTFPLTNNGKIDRRALPEPEAERPSISTPFCEPQSTAEKTLAGIWQEVLGISSVGANDNFFELGGDSIRAIVLLSKARNAGLEFKLEDLFASPTVAGLAVRAKSRSPKGLSPQTRPFGLLSDADKAQLPPDAVDAYPIAALQLGMFFHNELDPLSAMYHDVFSFHVEARCEVEIVREAAQNLINRHPVLRTSFHLAGWSEPLQIVHASVQVPFTSEDLQALSPEAQHKAILDWIEQEKRRPFDRSQAPLMRFHVQKQSPNAFQLFVSFHHSCTDGWSLAALVTEVLQDYTALLEGKTPQTGAPQTTYRDFVALERQSVESHRCASFWNDYLENLEAQTLPRWPKTHLREGHEQVRGPEIIIDPHILTGLKNLARKAGVPLKTVLLTAHMRVLSLLHGRKDLVTGLVSNGRPEQADGDKLIGLFLNTVPFRQVLTKGSWLEMVRSTFDSEQRILPFRRFPLAEAQRMQGHPILETAFDFVHFHVYNNLESCKGLKFSEGPYFEANNLATYTTFMLDATSTKLELHIDYDPTRVALEQIEKMDGYYLAALQSMAMEPSADALRVPLMSPEEAETILQKWNATREEYPGTATLHSLFEAKVKAMPEAIALECGNASLTYRQLDDLANSVASTLDSAGAGHGEAVGICIERSTNMIVALLGILKAGAHYVPLDPAFPSERLNFITRDSGVRFIITESDTRSVVAQAGATLVDIQKAVNGNQHHSVSHAADAHDLAYMIYTSGSTGNPKGVQIEHRSVINLLLSAAGKLGVTSSDRLLAVTTLSFDIAGLEIFMPLVTGGTVVIAEREVTGDGVSLGRLIEESRVTIMQATPSTWRMLIEAGWKGAPRLKAITGGEALPARLASELLARCKQLWNFYGPTETTIWSTAWQVDGSEPVSIGHPLANTQAFILDEDMASVPAGVTGELWLAGDGLARGYWNRPELTRERFVTRNQTRLYRTGDLARYLPDGRIECLGRVDHQVKVRGHRIELGEIENALHLHEGISEVVVTAREDRFAEKRLVAYYVPKAHEVPAKDPRNFLSSKLPGYMIPSHFVCLQKLPLTPNGKIDVKLLPGPESTLAATDFVPPSGETEKLLASIWTEVLDIPRIGAVDNFFDLGADSLSVTRAFARIQATTNAAIALRDLFEQPTVRLLAKAISSKPSVTPSLIKRQPRLTDLAHR